MLRLASSTRKALYQFYSKLHILLLVCIQVIFPSPSLDNDHASIEEAEKGRWLFALSDSHLRTLLLVQLNSHER